MLTPGFIKKFSAAAALVAILLYAAGVVVGIWFSWKSGDDPDWLTDEAMLYVVTGLSALVGGVVAAAFGVEPPEPEPEPDPAPEPSRTDRNLLALGAVLSADTGEASAQSSLAAVYVVVYFLLAAAAIVTWVLNAGDTLDFVRGLASAAVGLFLAIVRAFFQQPAS
jgi:hypothetical protein